MQRTVWPSCSAGISPAFALVLGLPLLIGLEPVDAAPPGLERDLAARSEALLLDERDHGCAGIAGRRMEHGEEALGDEVEHTPLVGRERLEVLFDVGRDDCVVVAHLRVVDDASERQLVEREHVLGSLAVVLDRLQRRGRRLQLREPCRPERKREDVRG